MRSTLESTLPWWIAGPGLGVVIISLLGLGNKRFGVLGGVTDLVQGSSEGRGLRSWRALLVIGIVLGGLAYTLLAGGADAGAGYSWLDAHLSLGGEVALLFAAGSPILPAAMARLISGMTAWWRVWKLIPSLTPACSQASTARRASSTVVASGLSQKTCLPAADSATTWSACIAFGVAT
jgi:hypothetical protein